MIFVLDTPGQLGNQLWAYSNIIALAKECKTKAIIIIENNYWESFDRANLKRCNSVKIFSGNSYKGKALKKMIDFITLESRLKFFSKYLPVLVFKNFIHENDFKQTYRKNHLYFLSSWECRLNKKFFLNNDRCIREAILPSDTIRKSVSEVIMKLKSVSKLLIGIHVRRGDYKEFENGIYFFDDNIYKKYMEQVLQLFNTDAIQFYLFSNESLAVKNYAPLNIYFQDKQDPVFDLWAMSHCDYILGPPSTFSMWASFWKKVPLYFITKTKTDLSLNMFRPIIAQDVFQ